MSLGIDYKTIPAMERGTRSGFPILWLFPSDFEIGIWIWGKRQEGIDGREKEKKREENEKEKENCKATYRERYLIDWYMLYFYLFIFNEQYSPMLISNF